MTQVKELSIQIDEVRMFLTNACKDVKLARYALEQQKRFLKQKEAELDALKDLFANMLNELEEVAPGSVKPEDRELLAAE